MYIQKYKIFENVRQAKKYLDENDIPYDNKDYIKLKNILSSNLGYLGKFTEWLFNDNSLSFLEDIYKMIKNVSLDKDINSFETSEDLYDYLTDKKFNTKVNQTINSLPSRTRRLANQELKDLIKNNIDSIDSIKDFYSKKGGRYKNIDDLIKDTKSLITNLQGEWNPDSIKYEDKELVYKDSNTLILWIDSYNRSCDLGSKHWCISTSEGMFKQYTSGFKKQYFIYDFTKDISDKKSMIGTTIDRSGKPTSIHYKDDTEGKKEDILPYLQHLKPYSKDYIKSKIDIDNIIKVSKYGLVDEVKRLLNKGIDLKPNDNYAMGLASENGHTEVIKLLLQDGRIDPSGNDNYYIRMASQNGHTDIVKLLLQDKRVDPSDYNNSAIRGASINGHTDIVKLLLQDERVDPSLIGNYAIRGASINGHTDVVKLLLQDERVDPSDNNNYAIIRASQKGYIEIVKLLLQDGRVDPSDNSNSSIKRALIRMSSNNGYVDIVKLLLQDKRVRKELTPEEIEKYNKVIVNHKP
jgi:ankyrin repeat protein